MYACVYVCVCVCVCDGNFWTLLCLFRVCIFLLTEQKKCFNSIVVVCVAGKISFPFLIYTVRLKQQVLCCLLIIYHAVE